MSKFNETFREVLKFNGVVSMTTWANGDAHVSNTWNSYLVITEDDKILLPAAWLNKTEANVLANENNSMIITLGSHEVQGKMGMGTGFYLKGTAKFLTEGNDFDMMKENFSFTTRVLEFTAETVKQTI